MPRATAASWVLPIRAFAAAAQSVFHGVSVQPVLLRKGGHGQAVVDEPLPGLFGSA
jgi:hypothetical protein